MRDPALIVFTKQPVAGQVKTRLQPDYTPAECATIAALLIRDTVDLVTSNWPGPLYLAVTPDTDHPLFHELAERYGIALIGQGDGDLGARMQRALAGAIAQHGVAAVMGCDVPHCPWEVLDEANGLMARGKSVLGPTEDGGYYLMGLTEAHEALFQDIAWGSSSVFTETLRRALTVDVEFNYLSRLRDIDTAADLWLVAKNYPALQPFVK
jgi:uncharacterized protein